MRRIMLVVTLFSICFAFPFALQQAASACTVSENYDYYDSAGTHYYVHNDAGEYLGYVTESSLDGNWTAWQEGVGAMNNIFSSKEEAATAVCVPQ
jgi:hypothetical protein